MKKKTMFEKMDESQAIKAIRQGLVMTVPLLMVGSFALIFRTLPFPFYQDFIATFADGFLSNFFFAINEMTFGILSLAATISISACYARQKTGQVGTILGAMFTALSAYMIFNGLFSQDFAFSSLGAQGMFTAIFSAVVGSAIFMKLMSGGLFSFRFYTVGADSDFNNVISIIIPAAIVVCLAYFFNQAVIALFEVAGFEALLHKSVNAIFNMIEDESVRTLLFVVLTNVFWLFGIHGTNVLESVARNIFYDTATAQTILTGIWSKPFIDTFVFMGGCGTTISLLLAMLLFSKQKNNRGLAKMAAFPMLFNINEMMVFGLPIVFNTSFFIPFTVVPLVCMFTAGFAILTGIVPPPVNSVSWVTPVVLGGYSATGSIAGSVLQIFNILLGAFIYRFFLIRYEEKATARMMSDLASLSDTLRKSEDSGDAINLLELQGSEGAIARMLAEDLRHVLKTLDSFELYYQPQFDVSGSCVGVEALLRWNHPRCGFIYPPLLVGIAKETNQLGSLERIVFKLASRDMAEFERQGILPAHVSVNATAASLRDSAFLSDLKVLLEENPRMKDCLCIELTEQMSFLLGEAAEERLEEIRRLGVSFAVDDFSMGHTSVRYLQTNLFDLVKLDGSLTRNITENPRSREIISSIVHMSRSMGFSVLAEYVETEEQRGVLEELGCCLYQGFLYSPAVPCEKLEETLKQRGGLPEAAKAH